MGIYFRLTDYDIPDLKRDNFNNPQITYMFDDEDIVKMPGLNYAYWATEREVEIFEKSKTLGDVGRLCLGMRTGDNKRFLRFWFEVADVKCGFYKEQKDSAKWIPYNKGGEYRKWYGNFEYVVNWENDGYEIKENTRLVYPQLGDNLGWKISNEDKYFHRGIAWSRISTKNFGVRYCGDNLIFDTAAPMMFPDNEGNLYYILGLMCSKIAPRFMQMINPTMAFQVGDVAKLPLVTAPSDYNEKIDLIVQDTIDATKEEWDEFETSWEFKKHPLI